MALASDAGIAFGALRLVSNWLNHYAVRPLGETWHTSLRMAVWSCGGIYTFFKSARLERNQLPCSFGDTKLPCLSSASTGCSFR